MNDDVVPDPTLKGVSLHDLPGKLRIVSGVGGKLPACFVVETAGKRIMLDLGEGPEPGVRPDISGLGRVDAILLSHAHEDHAWALDLADRLGFPPVHASAETWALLSQNLVPPQRRRTLPSRGKAGICGIEVTTGRAGHAPGSIWMHLGIGDGLLYTGDFSTESLLYPFDRPPRADTVIADCSYGGHDIALETQIDAIARSVSGGGVLPVPVGGRGPEMALRLVERGLPMPFLCPKIYAQSVAVAKGADTTVDPAWADRLDEMLPRIKTGVPNRSDIVICADSNLTSGLSRTIHEEWGEGTNFVFTGHVPPNTPATDLLRQGKGKWLRWNVHPRRSDIEQLMRDTGVKRLIAAFVEREKVDGLFSTVETALEWKGNVAI
jgi:Cft2 family RNA processing exonuclease